MTAPAVTLLWCILQTYVVAQALHKGLLGLWCDFAGICISEQLNHLHVKQVRFPCVPQHIPNGAAHLFGRLQLPYPTQQLPVRYVNSGLTRLLRTRFDAECFIHTDVMASPAARASLGQKIGLTLAHTQNLT